MSDVVVDPTEPRPIELVGELREALGMFVGTEGALCPPGETTRPAIAWQEALAEVARLRDLTRAPWLSDEEHALIAELGQIYNRLSAIADHGASRDGDLDEAASALHILQRMVMKNAAARAYPDRYRTLGGDQPLTPHGVAAHPAGSHRHYEAGTPTRLIGDNACDPSYGPQQ